MDLGSLISSASKLVGVLGRPVRYIFNYYKFVGELEEHGRTLTEERTRVIRDVDEAKLQPQTQVIEDCVVQWLTDTEVALYEVESLRQRIEENRRRFRRCPNFLRRYLLSKKIKKKTLAICQLLETSNFERLGHRAALPDLEFIQSKGYVASKSSFYAFSEIMEALESDEVKMIGVWGMGGLGKTTLVKVVGSKVKDYQLFDRVIYVVVSQAPNIENIQNKIADSISLKFEKTTPEDKAKELWVRLENEKKVLIILDDLWNELNLKEIGIPLNPKGCKIILTTRRRRVCESMENQLTESLDEAQTLFITVALGLLDEDEEWDLFKRKARLHEDEDDAEAIRVAKQVAKECKGLPVAIVTLASALKGIKTVRGWEGALKKLESSRLLEIRNIEGEEKNAYTCLKTSYDYLRREETKRCFLLCGVYPEAHSIDAEELVRHAWALGLYPDATSIKNARLEVFEDIDHLKDSCLLLEDDGEDDGERYIKLHDVVRDVAQWIASNDDIGLVTKSGSKQKLEILLHHNYDGETTIDYSEEMQELKVLSLKVSSELDNNVFSLNALESLPNLQALQLEGFKQIEGISALAKLTKLEILSLRGSSIEDSIDNLGELKNLKVLDMRQCKALLGFPSNIIRRLLKVEELYLFDSKGAATLSELHFLPRLAALSLEVPFLQNFPQDFRFRGLQRYQIAINREFGSYPGISSRSLSISNGELLVNAISELLWNVENLEVSNIMEKEIKYLTDTTRENVPVATVLQTIKGVRIEKCEHLQVIFQVKKVENHARLLSKLKFLCIVELPNLECIWNVPTQHISLRSLKVVKLKQCGKLKSVFSFSLAQYLICLEELRIESCDELQQIVEELEGDEQEISSSAQGQDREMLMFPRLGQLWLSDLSSLTSFSPVGYHLLFPDLFVLAIEDCSQMITSFTIDSESKVHAKTKAPLLDDNSPSKPYICWRRNPHEYPLISDELTELPPYVEQADEI